MILPPKDNSSYALITGATSGMGLEYARKLCRAGYNLIIVSRNGLKTDEVAEELRGQTLTPDQEILPLGIDLSEFDSAESVFEAVGARRVDILINNAGVLMYQDLTETPEARITAIHVLHNVTPVKLCRRYGAEMKSRGFGYILNISSLSAWMPYPGMAMYGATKRFTKSFSRSLRVELKDSGVSVTTAYFGAVSTNLFQLKDSYRRLAIRLRIMITAEKAARKALNAMFRRRANVMPGTVNHIARPILAILPNSFLHFIDGKLAGIKFQYED